MGHIQGFRLNTYDKVFMSFMRNKQDHERGPASTMVTECDNKTLLILDHTVMAPFIIQNKENRYYINIYNLKSE